MEDQNQKMKIVAVCGVWLTIAVVIGAAYRYWWAPVKEQERQEQVVKDRQETIDKTSTHANYKASILMGGDGFSGYAPVRSHAFREESLSKYGLHIAMKDDKGDYRLRLKRLASGETDMAVFTIDALIKCSTELGETPGTIVALIDESKGADAILAAGKKFPNIDALNSAETKFVCVADSPSETLARVVMANFKLDRLSESPFDFKNSEEDVYKEYQNAKPDESRVFVMWEPNVSKVAENPDYHVLLDSSKFRGYIMDVLVVNRGYLLKNEEHVSEVVKSYFTTLYASRNSMPKVVMDDAFWNNNTLTNSQAEKLCKTVWWKNMQENCGHFSITKGHGLQPMDEVCRNITSVLMSTGSIAKDISSNNPGLWYYDGVVRKLHESGWHPGFGDESVRSEDSLLVLTDEEWSKLRPVGTLQVPRLVFARGTSKLTEASETTLATLAEALKSWPQYYLIVRGNASSDGDVKANLKLATDRASAAVEWLTAHGVQRGRIRAESGKPNGSTTVLFILGEQPY